jgi:hypothetical protein
MPSPVCGALAASRGGSRPGLPGGGRSVGGGSLPCQGRMLLPPRPLRWNGARRSRMTTRSCRGHCRRARGRLPGGSVESIRFRGCGQFAGRAAGGCRGCGRVARRAAGCCRCRCGDVARRGVARGRGGRCRGPRDRGAWRGCLLFDRPLRSWLRDWPGIRLQAAASSASVDAEVGQGFRGT